MQKVIKQSRALLLMLAFLLAFAPMSALAGSGEKPTVNYIALGDSLAAGTLNTGDPSGGYVGNIVNDLESRGYDVNLTNKGKNGFTTAHVLKGLDEITAELASADLITISVGANDVLADLLGLIVAKPNILDSYNPEYMTPEGIAELELAVAAAEIEAQAAESAEVTALETARADIGIAKTSIDEVAATSALLIANLRAFFESTPHEDIAEEKILELEDAIATAVASVADPDNTEVEELESASNELKSAVTIIESVKAFIPDILKHDVQIFIAQIGAAVTETEIAKVSAESANAAGNIAIEARATADAAQLLFENVTILIEVFGKIQAKTQTVGVNIGTILGAIKSINSKAEIHVMGYYNALPYVDKRVVTTLLHGLNLAIQTPTNELGATFVPTAHLFDATNYLPDPCNIHPNDAGYAAIAGAFMGEIGKSFPKVEPEEPGEKSIRSKQKSRC